MVSEIHSQTGRKTSLKYVKIANVKILTVIFVINNWLIDFLAEELTARVGSKNLEAKIILFIKNFLKILKNLVEFLN